MSCFKSLLAFKWGQEEGGKKRSETHPGNVSSRISVYPSVPARSSTDSSRPHPHPSPSLLIWKLRPNTAWLCSLLSSWELVKQQILRVHPHPPWEGDWNGLILQIGTQRSENTQPALVSCRIGVHTQQVGPLD